VGGWSASTEVKGEFVEGLFLVSGHFLTILEGEVFGVYEVSACGSDELVERVDAQGMKGLHEFG